jgi:hypothetical protein
MVLSRLTLYQDKKKTLMKPPFLRLDEDEGWDVGELS